MDSQLFFLFDNNVLTPINQTDICYIISSEAQLPLSNDNNLIVNSTDVSAHPSVCDQVCDYGEQIMFLNEEEIPIDGANNEFFLEYHHSEIDQSEETIDQSIVQNFDPEISIQYNYKCEHCGAKFVHLKVLNRHKRTHVYKKPFKCDQCHESFNFLVNLKVHTSIYHDTISNEESTKNVCCVCNRLFRRFSTLRGHLKGHAVSEYFNCEHCDEIFLAKLFYDTHCEKYHKKEDKASKITKVSRNGNGAIINQNCKLCGKMFKKPSMLIRHMRVHNGEKPFKCEVCAKQFSQKNTLNIHLLRHTGDKPHVCSLCQMRFTQRGNLKIHKEKVHNKYNLNEDETKYPCNKCSCVFRKIGSLNRHITEVHCTKNQTEKFIDRPDSSNDNINFTDIFSQINGLNQIPTIEAAENQSTNIIQLADRLENGVLIHHKVQQNIDRGKKRLSCINCGKTFTRPSDLLRHIRVHTKEKPFECYLCKRRFSVKRTLSVHYKTHESTLRKFACSICCKNFRNVATLIDHGSELHQNCDNYLQCFPCKENFSNVEQLEAHSKFHNRRLLATKRKCYDTSIQMQDPIILNQETKVEDTRRRLYKCDKCCKSFIKLCHLKQHHLSHTVDRPFKCDKCIKSFKSRNSLTIHNRRHLNMKPYNCDICNESFVSKPILNRHKLIHSEVRNFICPYCQKSFKSNSHCRKHIRIHQKEVMSPLVATTDICPDETAKVIQPNARACQYCNRYFKKPIDLRRHERIHTGERPFKCNKCEKSFSLQSTLKIHQRIHEKNDYYMYTCHVCSNKYTTKSSLNVHKRIHTGEKPFKCKYCEAVFRTNGHRSVHEMSHIKTANERGIDPKEVKIIRQSKFDSIVENLRFT